MTARVPRSPVPEEYDLEADTLRALANPRRLMILAQLGESPRTVTELAERVGLPLPSTSQHLRVLRDRRVVRADRDGHVVRYRLSDPAFGACCALVRRAIRQEMSHRTTGPADEAPGDQPLAPREVLAA